MSFSTLRVPVSDHTFNGTEILGPQKIEETPYVHRNRNITQRTKIEETALRCHRIAGVLSA